MDSIQYKSDYYTKNKERILEKMNMKINCNVCGSIYTFCHKNRHFRTAKHQNKQRIINYPIGE